MKVKFFAAIIALVLAGLFVMPEIITAAPPKCHGLKKAACVDKKGCKWTKGKRDPKTRKLVVKGKCDRNQG
jgi:hypothetical protein